MSEDGFEPTEAPRTDCVPYCLLLELYRTSLLPEGLIVWGPYTNPCVCVRPFVRSCVRTVFGHVSIKKTHASKGFGQKPDPKLVQK